MINYSKSEMAWINLPSEQKEMFNNIAAKDGDPSMDGQDWFNHLVPSELQDNASEVEVFMNGGTVEQQVWVYDQGTNSGHYETVSYEIADKDVSRIQSGHNGGEYSTDNTIMEDAGTNRARGSADMTEAELAEAESVIESETILIDGGEVITDATEVADGAITAAESVDTGAEIIGTFTEVATDILAPAIGAYLAGTTVASKMESTEDKLGYGSLAAGAAALVCMTPPGQFCLAAYGITKLSLRAIKWLSDDEQPQAV